VRRASLALGTRPRIGCAAPTATTLEASAVSKGKTWRIGLTTTLRHVEFCLGAVPPQNPVDGTIVDVSALGVKLAIALRTTSSGATRNGALGSDASLDTWCSVKRAAGDSYPLVGSSELRFPEIVPGKV
jgi:hypothetical protein